MGACKSECMCEGVRRCWCEGVMCACLGSKGLLKKQEAFESDLEVHRGRVDETSAAGRDLISKVGHVTL